MGRLQDDLLREVRRMQSRMNAMMHGVSPRPATGKIFIPPGDVYETDKAFWICLDVAGVDKNDMEILLKDRVLFISGRRRLKAPAGARVHQMEIDCGAFHKAFELPCAVKAEAVATRYEDGLLIIEIPKPETCQIEVQSE